MVSGRKEPHSLEIPYGCFGEWLAVEHNLCPIVPRLTKRCGLSKGARFLSDTFVQLGFLLTESQNTVHIRWLLQDRVHNRRLGNQCNNRSRIPEQNLGCVPRIFRQCGTDPVSNMKNRRHSLTGMREGRINLPLTDSRGRGAQSWSLAIASRVDQTLPVPSRPLPCLMALLFNTGPTTLTQLQWATVPDPQGDGNSPTRWIRAPTRQIYIPYIATSWWWRVVNT